jgi:hypothetical protein
MSQNIAAFILGQQLYMRENMRLLAFSNSIHLPENDKISFFFVAEQNSIVYKCWSQFGYFPGIYCVSRNYFAFPTQSLQAAFVQLCSIASLQLALQCFL